jgi:hypothetical protein
MMEEITTLAAEGKQTIEIESPQELKPTPFELCFGTTEQLAEKLHISGQCLEKFPPAKAAH